jgi:hypothetical protein
MSRHLTALAALAMLTLAAGTAHGQTMSQEQFDQGLRGAHDMKGRITSVDKKTGIVQVNIGSDVLKLHFPPPAVQNLEKDDPLVFRLGIKEVKSHQEPAD